MSSSQVAPPASPVRIVVARATEASDRDGFGVAGTTEVDLVGSGGTDLPEPPDADLRRAVRMHPDLPERRAAQALADGISEAFLSGGDPGLAAAALSFVLGLQRGVTAPVLAAVVNRSAQPPLVIALIEGEVLARCLVRCLDGPSGVVRLAAQNAAAFAAAAQDSNVGLVVGSTDLVAGLIAGWLAAGGFTPEYVVLGVPAVAVVGNAPSALSLIRALVDKNLIGCAREALTTVVAARRQAAGLESE